MRRDSSGHADWEAIVIGALIIVWILVAYLNGHDHRHDELVRYKAKVEACTRLPDNEQAHCLKGLD